MVQLHVFRQRGRNAVRIDGVVVQPFRLQEDLVAVAVAELDDLVLDRRAIARPDTFDRAGIHGRTAEIVPDQIMGRRRRARDAAFDLRIGNDDRSSARRATALRLPPAFRATPSRSSAVKPRRRARLQPPKREAGTRQCLRQAERRLLVHAAGRESSSRRYGSARAGTCRSSAPRRRSRCARPSPRTTAAIATVWRSRSRRPRPSMTSRPCCSPIAACIAMPVELAIGLGARPADRRSLAPIEQTKLDAGRVGHPAHQAVESVDLTHQMTLAEPADRRIAGHDADRVGAQRDQRRRAPARAAAAAASQPAWPPPITMTSNLCCMDPVLPRAADALHPSDACLSSKTHRFGFT